MIDVVLSIPELRFGAYVGVDRWVRHKATPNGWKYNDGRHVNDELRDHVLGVWGELVIAKTVGCYPANAYLGRPDGGAPDVGRWHVRTAAEPGHRLTMWDTDDDNDPFVLVVQMDMPTFRIVGWCYGHEGKRPEHRNTTTARGGYFVSQSALRPWVNVESFARPPERVTSC